MRRAAQVWILGLAAALAGCASLEAGDRGPRTDAVARLAPAGPSPWTDDLGDPILRDFLGRSDAGALDAKAALARLERADAEVEAAAAANPLRVPVGLVAAVGGGTLHSARSAATPTVEASYEVDLWGRFKRLRGAAEAGSSAARFDVTAERLMVGAETVRAYVALRAAEDARAAGDRRRASAEAALGLVRARRAQGAATGQDVETAERTVAEQAARRAALDDEIALQTARLGDLAGRRDLVVPGGEMPFVTPDPPAAPAGDVDHRPDVQAAFARLEAADQRRAAAVAAARPQFQIVAALGSPNASIASLLDVRGLAWAAAATLTQDLLDGGARRARVHLANAEADEADIAYRQAVLAGWSEMRAALAAQAEAARRLGLAEQALAAARNAATSGDARHAAGAADGLDVIGLATRAEAASDAVRDARVALIEARVRRRLAAGGR